jgi:hypothetical protein
MLVNNHRHPLENFVKFEPYNVVGNMFYKKNGKRTFEKTNCTMMYVNPRNIYKIQINETDDGFVQIETTSDRFWITKEDWKQLEKIL